MLKTVLLLSVGPVRDNTINNKPAPDLVKEKREAPIKWYNCSFEKVEKAVLQTSNTAPGIDKIPSRIIQ